MERCSLVLDSYLFELDRVVSSARLRGAKRLVLEAPQGMVRLLPELAEALERCIPGVEAVPRLEPSYGLCSVSLEGLGPGELLVHVGHEFYPYPFCTGHGCIHGLPGGVVVVPGVYLGGDAEKLAEAVMRYADEEEKIVIASTAQHMWLAERVAELLRSSGLRVEGVFPVVGCYYTHLLRKRASLYLVVAGGRFHSLGLGLASAGEARILNLDPYSDSVEDVAGLVSKTLAKRMWRMREFLEARRIGVIEGLLPGQRRPGIAEAVIRLARRSGREARRLYAARLTREYLDNLKPGSFDAYVVTSCPRLAVEDLGDYWKPVLAPGEAREALMRGKVEAYAFPW